jgi:hypothetical protein
MKYVAMLIKMFVELRPICSIVVGALFNSIALTFMTFAIIGVGS